VRRFLEAERIALPEVRLRELRRARIDKAFVVDCSSQRRLGEVGELVAAAGAPWWWSTTTRRRPTRSRPRR